MRGAPIRERALMFDDDDVVIALYNTKIKIKYNFQF